MPSLFHLARLLDTRFSRRAIAWAASSAMRWRGDARRFGVANDGFWINRQPDATLFSPDIHTATFRQIEGAVLDCWCQTYRPKQGDTIVDVGAGIGEEAVVFSRMVGPAGRVIAIEAHPRTFSALERTVEASGLENVVPLQLAIADADGFVTVDDNDAHLGNSIVSGLRGGIPVKAESLDRLASRLPLSNVDLLKMNIEGAERLALLGMARLAPNVRHVAVSCHDFVAERTGAEEFRTRAFVREQLKRLGFEVKTRTEPGPPWVMDTLFGSRSG